MDVSSNWLDVEVAVMDVFGGTSYVWTNTKKCNDSRAEVVAEKNVWCSLLKSLLRKL